MSNKIEKRTFELRAESQGDELALVGRAVTYNRISSNEISSNVRERIMPGAFADTLDDDNEDVKALVNHSSDRILGRRANGTLQLRDNSNFLGVRIQLDPKVQWHRDIYQQVKRGDLNEMSFAFRCDDESFDEGEYEKDGKRCEEHREGTRIYFRAQRASPLYRNLRAIFEKAARGVAPNEEAARKSSSPSPLVSHVLMSRYNREELYERVWSEPIQRLAREYGLSDVGLAKVCRKLHIPSSVQSHPWAAADACRGGAAHADSQARAQLELRGTGARSTG